MRSVMMHNFSQVPAAHIQRSSFDRSHAYKTTLDAGWLIPIFVDEVLPGDTFSVNMTGFCRIATPLQPFMDNCYFTTFFFFVPHRLVWDNWQKFNGEQRNPGDSTDFLVPQVNAPVGGGFDNGSIYDYFGLPVQTGGADGFSLSALPLRSYNLIYNDWFRDENLQDSVVNHVDDGPDPATDYTLLKRGKRHDYFTSCLPWPQKGESVTIPLGTTAPVVPSAPGAVPTFTLASSSGTYSLATTGGPSAQTTIWNTVPDGGFGQASWASPRLSADLTGATAATINQLRQAFQIQRLYERDARGGTRYTEIVRSHFGVVSPDARLQRPEYLGGGRSPVNIHTVPQTSASDITGGATPQGNLAAYGTSVLSRHGFSKGFTEHGTIIGLVCITADLTYQQGLDRMWSRRGRFDFYWPALAHIGEQAVLSQEIYCSGDAAADNSVFGYQERYAEYRYKPSRITGQMRSSFAQSLDTWHLSQDFASRPNLNAAFIEENPPFARVVAVPSEPNFIGDFYFKMRCARPMPVYGVPGMIDHF